MASISQEVALHAKQDKVDVHVSQERVLHERIHSCLREITVLELDQKKQIRRRRSKRRALTKDDADGYGSGHYAALSKWKILGVLSAVFLSVFLSVFVCLSLSLSLSLSLCVLQCIAMLLSLFGAI